MGTKETNDVPHYPRVTYWVKEYGMSGNPDQKCIEEFVELETRELVNGLYAELTSIAAGRFKEESLDKIVGGKRKLAHGSYDAWAKAMLMWLAGAAKQT